MEQIDPTRRAAANLNPTESAIPQELRLSVAKTQGVLQQKMPQKIELMELPPALRMYAPWTEEEQQKCEKYSLGFLSGAVYSLGAFSLYQAAQVSGTGRLFLAGTGAILVLFGSCTNCLCVRVHRRNN